MTECADLESRPPDILGVCEIIVLGACVHAYGCVSGGMVVVRDRGERATGYLLMGIDIWDTGACRDPGSGHDHDIGNCRRHKLSEYIVSRPPSDK